MATKEFMAVLLTYLVAKTEVHEAVVELINKYAPEGKEFKVNRLHYFLHKKNVVRGWQIKSALLAAIEKAWSPTGDDQNEAMHLTLLGKKADDGLDHAEKAKLLRSSVPEPLFAQALELICNKK